MQSHERLRQKAECSKSSQHPYQPGGHTRNRSGLGDQKPGPPIQKAPQRPVSIAHIDILSPGIRTNRAQLRVGERSKERKQTSKNPSQINQARRADRLHHLRRNKKNAAPNNGSRDNRDRMPDVEPADQLWPALQLMLRPFSVLRFPMRSILETISRSAFATAPDSRINPNTRR